MFVIGHPNIHHSSCSAPFALQKSLQVDDTDSPSTSDQANPDRGLDEHPEAEVTVKTAEDNIYSSAKTFEELNLHPDLLKGEKTVSGC